MADYYGTGADDVGGEDSLAGLSPETNTGAAGTFVRNGLSVTVTIPVAVTVVEPIDDGSLTGTVTLVITGQLSGSGTIPANQTIAPPVITSNGGQDAAVVDVASGSTTVTQVAATDSSGIAPTYSVSGGADAADFTINSATGQLSFVSPPNSANPTDANGDNVYEVTVLASDGEGNATAQAIRVTVIPVTKHSTTITMGATPNPAAYGTVVTLSATVAGTISGEGTPTGSIIFYDGGTAPLDNGSPAVLVNGIATFTTSSLAVGSHSITATYSGDSNFNPPTSAVSPVTVQIAAAPMVVGSPVINPGQGAHGSNTYLGNSRVLSIQLTFNTPIDNTAALQSAFTLTRAGLPDGVPGDGAAIGQITATVSTSNPDIVTLTFSGANTEGGSLADGNWTLSINPADVTSNGVPMASSYSYSSILRLFGDYNASGTVDSSDLGVLGTTFGLTQTSSPRAYISAFDSDGNGEIDSIDLGAFGTRFGLII